MPPPIVSTMTPIAGGAWVGMEIADVDEDGNVSEYTRVGLCAGASYTEDFRVVPAEVIGLLGPVSFDSQGYNCQINVDILVRKDRTNIDTILKTRRRDIMDNGKMPEKALRFVNVGGDYDAGVVDATFREFRGVVLSNNGEQIRPNQYVTANLQFMAMERTV